jgi:hypothetical protein
LSAVFNLGSIYIPLIAPFVVNNLLLLGQSVIPSQVARPVKLLASIKAGFHN